MPEPKKADVTAEFLATEDQEGGQPPAGDQLPAEPAKEPGEKPAEEPAKEPEKKEAEPPKAEEDVLIPQEDLDAIYDQFGGEIAERPPLVQPPPAPAPQPAPPSALPPDIPQEIYQITPQQFMPQGQDFDPMEAYTPGTPSHAAAVRAQSEQTRRLTTYERERYDQEQMTRQQMEAIQNFIAEKKREGVPDKAIQGFLNEITDSRKPISLDFLWNAKLLEKRQALRKAQGARKSARGEEIPPPVTDAPRVTEKPVAPDELNKAVEELIGPKDTL